MDKPSREHIITFGALPGEGIYEADAQTDLAIDYVRRESGTGTPFALFLSYGPPHDPWTDENTPERFRRLFDGVDFPDPSNYQPDDDPYGDEWSRLMQAQRRQLPHWCRNYYAQVANLDWNLGRLMEALADLGLEGDTILVFTSDHGEMFGAHGRRAKNIFYEEACRVPFLLRWSGRVPADLRSDAPLGTVDILPTLCGLMGLEPPEGVQGMNLSHVALGVEGPEPEAAMMMICGATAAWEDGYEWRALHDKRYTYAIYGRDGKEFLFDHVNDPYQLTNLMESSAHVATARAFQEQLATKMTAIRDTFERCTYYRDHWTDGDRRILRSVTHDWSHLTRL